MAKKIDLTKIKKDEKIVFVLKHASKEEVDLFAFNLNSVTKDKKQKFISIAI